jgi:hypothetical protein
MTHPPVPTDSDRGETPAAEKLNVGAEVVAFAGWDDPPPQARGTTAPAQSMARRNTRGMA